MMPALRSISKVGRTSACSWSSTPVRHSSSISISRLSITVATFRDRSWTLSLAWTYRAYRTQGPEHKPVTSANPTRANETGTSARQQTVGSWPLSGAEGSCSYIMIHNMRNRTQVVTEHLLRIDCESSAISTSARPRRCRRGRRWPSTKRGLSSAVSLSLERLPTSAGFI